jgi:hypothetical protein
MNVDQAPQLQAGKAHPSQSQHQLWAGGVQPPTKSWYQLRQHQAQGTWIMRAAFAGAEPGAPGFAANVPAVWC